MLALVVPTGNCKLPAIVAVAGVTQLAFLFGRSSLGADRSPKIAALLQKQVKRHHLAGMGAIVIQAHRVVGIATAGTRDQRSQVQLQTDDLFHLGSNTKAITATMMARLVEAGKLSFATTPVSVFPELKDTIDPAFRYITIEQLLSHHAGVPPYSRLEELRSLPNFIGSEVQQRAKFAAWVLQHPPAVPPGTKGLYSNAGLSIATAMAERVTGLDWETLVSSEVLAPLQMHAIFGYPLRAGQNQPSNHLETATGVRAISEGEAWQIPPYLRPAGDLSMSLRDYGKFLQMNLSNLEGAPDGFLSVAMVRRLHTSPLRDEYALGWGISQIDGLVSSSHAGSGGSFYALVTLQPGRDLGVAVLADSAGDRTAAACDITLKSLLDTYAPHSDRGNR